MSTPHSMKPWKTQRDAYWDVAIMSWMGQAEDSILQVCQLGKVPKPIPASLRDTPARKLGKELPRTASRQNRVRDQASQSRKQQTAVSHSVHWWPMQSPKTRMSFTVNLSATTIHEVYTVSIYSLTMDVEAVTHALRWIASRGDSYDHACHHRHRVNELANK